MFLCYHGNNKVSYIIHTSIYIYIYYDRKLLSLPHAKKHPRPRAFGARGRVSVGAKIKVYEQFEDGNEQEESDEDEVVLRG